MFGFQARRLIILPDQTEEEKQHRKRDCERRKQISQRIQGSVFPFFAQWSEYNRLLYTICRVLSTVRAKSYAPKRRLTSSESGVSPAACRPRAMISRAVRIGRLPVSASLLNSLVFVSYYCIKFIFNYFFRVFIILGISLKNP